MACEMLGACIAAACAFQPPPNRPFCGGHLPVRLCDAKKQTHCRAVLPLRLAACAGWHDENAMLPFQAEGRPLWQEPPYDSCCLNIGVMTARCVEKWRASVLLE